MTLRRISCFKIAVCRWRCRISLRDEVRMVAVDDGSDDFAIEFLIFGIVMMGERFTYCDEAVIVIIV